MIIPAHRPECDSEGRFPVRVVVAAPPARQLATMRAWLDQNFSAAAWASAPAGFGGVVNDAIAFYFAELADARAFINRFGCGYRAEAILGVRAG